MLSGFYALACRKEAGPRGSRTEEQAKEGNGRGPSKTENRLRTGNRLRTRNRLRRHREREQKTTQIGTTTNMYLWMQITNRARCYNPRWGTKGMPTKTDRAANRCRSLYDATRRDGEAGRRCCWTHSGRSTDSASLLETCTGTQWSRRCRERARTERERSSESVRQHFVLPTRDAFCLLRPLLL